MGVDIRLNIGFGFIVSQERCNTMIKVAESKDLLDDIEDRFYAIDGYSDKSNYFLGELFKTTDNVEPIALAEVVPADFDSEQFARVYEEIFDICDVSINEDWCIPKFYTFLSIT